MAENTSVAVIGLGKFPDIVLIKRHDLTCAGPAGLVALKNLREEGFDAIGFDRNSYIGGLWQYSAKGQTSVMETTVVNISKERVGNLALNRQDRVKS
jgi:ribulose 1,5-bisphosphate synthetase/thiazole synthase